MLRLLHDATEWTAKAVSGVGEDHLSLLSTCTEWDVATLRQHVVEGAMMFAAAIGADVSGIPDGPPDTRYRQAAAALLAALAEPDAMGRMAELPIGGVPGSALTGIVLVEAAGHGWDLARSTGQDAMVPGPIAEAALEVAHRTIGEAMRPHFFAGPMAVPAEASPTDRLVAYLGRHP